MATDVEICNSAIAKVRGRRILTLSDDTTEARLCSALYPVLRKKLLRAHPWNFSKRRAELAQDAAAPEWGYAYKYQLPSDCLKLLETDIPYNSDWALEEDSFILSDTSTVFVLYVADITDAARFDALFAEVLAYMLAAELALPITGGAAIAKAMKEAAKEELAQARSMNAQERGSVKQVEADTWLDARF